MNEGAGYAILAALGGFLIIIALIAIAVEVVFIIGKWKLFKKAGKNGWEAIIPFYSDWVLVEIAGLDWWWFLLLIAQWIVSILSNISSIFSILSPIAYLAVIFARISISMNLSKKLNKDMSFVILTTIFQNIMLTIVGFSNSYQYDASVEVSKMGILEKIISKNNQNTNQNVQPNVQNGPITNQNVQTTNDNIQPSVENVPAANENVQPIVESVQTPEENVQSTAESVQTTNENVQTDVESISTTDQNINQ